MQLVGPTGLSRLEAVTDHVDERRDGQHGRSHNTQLDQAGHPNCVAHDKSERPIITLVFRIKGLDQRVQQLVEVHLLEPQPAELEILNRV